MEDLIAFVTTHGKDLLAIVGALVTLATLIVKLTPSQKDDAFMAKIVKVLGKFATVEPKIEPPEKD